MMISLINHDRHDVATDRVLVFSHWHHKRGAMPMCSEFSAHHRKPFLGSRITCIDGAPPAFELTPWRNTTLQYHAFSLSWECSWPCHWRNFCMMRDIPQDISRTPRVCQQAYHEQVVQNYLRRTACNRLYGVIAQAHVAAVAGPQWLANRSSLRSTGS